jgi:xanthine phosphoribosyltransferase
VNHMIDPELMNNCALELAHFFQHLAPTKVLTVETSGVAPSLLTALHLKCPVIYCRSGKKPITMPRFYTAKSRSHTKGGEVDLYVSQEFLREGDRVLIIDDFLATGVTIKAMVELVVQAKATLIGIGALIEKSFESGRQVLSELVDVPIHSLVVVAGMEEDKIIFAENIKPLPQMENEKMGSSLGTSETGE